MCLAKLAKLAKLANFRIVFSLQTLASLHSPCEPQPKVHFK